MNRRHLLPRSILTALSLGAASALTGPALAESTQPQPSAAQPALPGSDAAPSKPDSPVVEEMAKEKPALVVRKRATHRVKPRRHQARRHGVSPEIDRPALAGVQLVAPLPPPPEPPHIIVPTPAYPLDTLAAAFFTPPPPIVCHPTRRDPTQPDPHLYKESPVACEPDNP